jgi:hypothetical protein
LLSVLAVTTPGASALAWDWTITGAAGDTFTYSDNPNLDIPEQWGAQNNAFFNFNIEGRTPTLRMNLTSSGLGYTSYWGPAWEDQDNQFQPNISVGFTKDTKNTSFFGNAFFTVSDLDTVLQDENIFRNVTGTQTNIGGGGGFTHRFDRLNSLTWTANYNATEYDPVSNDLFPSDTVSTSVSWSHSMNRLNDIGPTVSFSVTDYDIATFEPSPIPRLQPPPLPPLPPAPPSDSDIPPPDVASIQAIGWWNARLTKRLTLRATAGVGLFNQSYDGDDRYTYNGPTDWVPEDGYNPIGIAEWSIVPVWSVSIEDRVWDNSTFSFSASESTSPNSFGDLQSTFNISMGFNHVINEFSDIALGFSYSSNTGQDSFACADQDPCLNREDLATNSFDFSVLYNRDLWRYWSGSVGYTFTRSKFADEGDEYATENAFTATIRREFTLLR